MRLLEKLFMVIRSHIRTPITGQLLPKVARRYIAINLYDGSLLALGIVVSSMLLNLPPSEAVLNGVIIGFSSAVSGFMGAFLVERAELIREVKELEKHLFIRLGTRQVYVSGLFLSLLNAASTSTPVFIAVIPFILADRSIISFDAATVSSLLLVLASLLILGFYLGRMARENPLKYGLLTLASASLIILLEVVLSFK